MAGKILKEHGIPVPYIYKEEYIKRGEKYGYPKCEGWAMTLSFAAWLYEHLQIYMKLADLNDMTQGKLLVLKPDLFENSEEYIKAVKKESSEPFAVHELEDVLMPSAEYLKKFCDIIAEYLKGEYLDDWRIPLEIRDQIEWEQGTYIIDTFGHLIGSFNPVSIEDNESPEGEYWDLRKSAIKWLYAHYRLFRDDAVIDLSVHKFNVPVFVRKTEGDVHYFRIESMELVQGEVIDFVIAQLESVLSEGITKDISTGDKAIISNCFTLFALTHGAMWW